MFTRGALAAISGLLAGNVILLAGAGVTGIKESRLQGFAFPPNLIQIVTLNLIVTVGEAVVTGFVVDHLSTVRSNLLGDQRYEIVPS
jgi:hypothetical protein